MRIGITGHRHLGGSDDRKGVHAEISARLRERARPGDEALSSLAIGADQIFAQAALEAGLRLHAVVPCEGYDATFSPEELQGYEALLTAATEVTTLAFPIPSEIAFEAAGRWIVDHCDAVIAVWNGCPASGRGGTGDIVDYARSKNVQLVVIPVM
ncbi:hypothetical protein ACSRUE_27525 [Sorangium sp. KYC3313]|uniref:hypothetical protein n=1 Tax=Sorangium sp. KYC3313 TaxID=3449740 RepID=UPI003F89987D